MIALTTMGAGGLNGLIDTVILDYIGPVFIGFIAYKAVMALKDGQTRQLISLGLMGAVVATLVFGAKQWYAKDGILTRQAENIGNKLN